jgi:hypothetical protein
LLQSLKYRREGRAANIQFPHGFICFRPPRGRQKTLGSRMIRREPKLEKARSLFFVRRSNAVMPTEI